MRERLGMEQRPRAARQHVRQAPRGHHGRKRDVPSRDALPSVMMSGTTPYGSSADQVPVRPAPVRISSATSRTPWRSQAARTRRQYSGAGTDAPVDDPRPARPCTAATVPGPSRRSAASTASPLQLGQSGGTPRQAQR